MKSELKDKVIELLKQECGLKGQLINMMLEIDGMNEILSKHNKLNLLSQYINSINEINDEVMKLLSSNN